MRQQKGGFGEEGRKKYCTVQDGWLGILSAEAKEGPKTLEYGMEYDTKIHTGGLTPDETCIN